MKQEEARRRILDLLLQAAATDTPRKEDSEIAEQLQIRERIVQGNLQLLYEAGLIDLETLSFHGDGQQTRILIAELSPRGEVLLYEEQEGGGPEALAYARKILAILDWQVAHFGEAYAPPYLIVQRDDQQQRVAELEAQLAAPESAS